MNKEFYVGENGELVLKTTSFPEVVNVPNPKTSASEVVLVYTFFGKRVPVLKTLPKDVYKWLYSYLIQLEDAGDLKTFKEFRTALKNAGGHLVLDYGQPAKKPRKVVTSINAGDINSIEGLELTSQGYRISFAKNDKRKKKQRDPKVSQLVDGSYSLTKRRGGYRSDSVVSVTVKCKNKKHIEYYNSFLNGLTAKEFEIFANNYVRTIPTIFARNFVSKSQEYQGVFKDIAFIDSKDEKYSRTLSLAEQELALALKEEELAKERVRLATLKASMVENNVSLTHN